MLGALSLEGTAFGQAQDLKVGFLMPLTGGAGRLGQMMLEGAQLAVEEVNLSGGVAGASWSCYRKIAKPSHVTGSMAFESSLT